MKANELIPVAALEKEVRGGHYGLKFDDQVEQQFLKFYLPAMVPQRLVLMAIAIMLVGLMPVVDAYLLHPPLEIRGDFRIAQFGIMIPAVIMAMCVTAFLSPGRLADCAGFVAALGLVLGVQYQRHVGAEVGYEVPSELIAVIFAGAILISGIRARFLAPACVILFLTFVACEIHSFGADSRTLYTIYSVLMLVGLCGFGAYATEYRTRSSWLQSRLLAQVGLRDPLTGYLTSGAFDPMYRKSFAHASREPQAICVCVFDIDFFGDFNERYGHSVGDACLREVAECLDAGVRRDTDIKARVRGESFVVVWYGGEREPTLQRIEQMRLAVMALGIPHERSNIAGHVVTVSAGAVWIEAGTAASPDAVMRAAEQHMRQAKRSGRNQVIFSNDLGTHG